MIANKRSKFIIFHLAKYKLTGLKGKNMCDALSLLILPSLSLSVCDITHRSRVSGMPQMNPDLVLNHLLSHLHLETTVNALEWKISPEGGLLSISFS